VFAALIERQVGKVAEPGHAEADGPLVIVDFDAQAAETGGTEGRDAGIGVPVFSVRESG
jgi:hypothetical protein